MQCSEIDASIKGRVQPRSAMHDDGRVEAGKCNQVGGGMDEDGSDVVTLTESQWEATNENNFGDSTTIRKCMKFVYVSVSFQKLSKTFCQIIFTQIF